MPDAGAEEREFQRLWGPWEDATPARAATLMEGFRRPWWISGGWAIDAFTGIERPHKDVDVAIFRRDVAELRRHVHGRYDLWSAGSATLRPLDDEHPLPRWAGQVWMREHALAPWVADVVLNPGGPRRWVFKRDRRISLPLEEATWVAADGIRYLRPELVLAHKLRHTRVLDDRDLAAALPLLDVDAAAFLLELVRRSDPAHRWRRPLEEASRRRKSVRAGDPRHERSSVPRP
jgi:hypothetical protein